jgi:hypothetical protein
MSILMDRTVANVLAEWGSLEAEAQAVTNDDA